MHSLTRRLDKLEEERIPDAAEVQRNERLLLDLEKARQRVLAEFPDHEFPNFEEPLPLLPGGMVDIRVGLERSRQWALKKILAA